MLFNVLLLEFISLVVSKFNGLDAAMLVVLDDKNDALLLLNASLFNVSAVSSLMRLLKWLLIKFNGFFFLKLNVLLLFDTSIFMGSEQEMAISFRFTCKFKVLVKPKK
jgi:hypothetical protein